MHQVSERDDLAASPTSKAVVTPEAAAATAIQQQQKKQQQKQHSTAIMCHWSIIRIKHSSDDNTLTKANTIDKVLSPATSISLTVIWYLPAVWNRQHIH